MRFKGKVWRHVPAGGQPLNIGYILRAGGRWNRQGSYACLYTAVTQDGARAEYAKSLRRSSAQDLARKTRELVSIDVDLERVADLTDRATSPVAPNEPFLTSDEPTDLEACRTLADALRAQGYDGILVPSAAAPGEKNLVIYIDGPPERVRLGDAGDRIPLK